MFAPTRIEITNLGSIPHAIIEPHPTGITALDGPTGAGKSSALNALIWVCFGYVGGVDSFNRQADLRFDLCPDGEPAEGIVEFDWRGTHVKAVRRLRRSKAGKETAEAELWLDGVRQPTITPDRLTAKIEEITGLSGRAFVSTFFIPQMQLERMAMGTPADVQALIEDRTGLTPLTGKIADARQAALQAETAADALPGSPEEVQAAQADVDSAQQAAVDAWQTWETADAAARLAAEAHTQARTVLTGLESRQRATMDAQRAVDRLQGRITALTDTRDRLAVQVADLGPVPDRATAAAELKRLRDAVDTLNRAAWQVQQTTTALQGAEARHREASEAMGWHSADPAADAKAAASRWETLEGERRSLLANYERLQAERAKVIAHQADPTCPTCLQAMPSVGVLVALFDDQMASIRERGVQVAAQVKLAATERDLRAQQANDAIRDQQTLNDATRTLSDVRQAHQIATSNHAAAQQTLSVVLPGVTDPAAAQPHLTALADQVGAAERAAQVIAEHQQADTDLAAAQHQMDTAAKLTTDVVSDDVMETARTTEWETQQASATATAASHTAQLDAERLRTEVATREQVRDAAQLRLTAKIDALTHAETLRFAAATLTEQRKELLARYTATISEAASRIMEAVGGGRHVGVVVDERFVPEVVLADGRRRPVRSCSGGEKMRAALCLCLGQVEQQSGGDTAGMIFADEIATGYDADTTMAVMSMLTSLNRPMVLIGHNEQTRQIAQRVYDFTNPSDTGTQVALAGGNPIPVNHIPTPTGAAAVTKPSRARATTPTAKPPTNPPTATPAVAGVAPTGTRKTTGRRRTTPAAPDPVDVLI